MKKPEHLDAYGWLDGEYMSHDELEEAYMGMIDALIELNFLNQCELEGLSAGQPAADQWRLAFEKAENALKKAGCVE